MSSPTNSIFDDLPPKRSEDDPDSEISEDSLFDEPHQAPLRPKNSRIPRQTLDKTISLYPAQRSLEFATVPGLHYDQGVTISPDLEAEVVDQCLRTWFIHPESEPRTVLHLDRGLTFNDVNQVMLFNRTDGITPGQSCNPSWPKCLTDLLIQVSHVLKPPALDPEIWDLLFSTSGGTREERDTGMRSRQAIINLYHPGEGISDHIDLLDRYGDGIVGVSLGSGCVMRFRCAEGQSGGYQEAGTEVDERLFTRLYLPPRSVIVMTGDARFRWSHGIPGRVTDLVEAGDTTVEIARGMRLSVTFRWLLPGADVVGTA